MPRLRNKKTVIACENCGDTSHKSYDCPIHIIDDDEESSVKGKKQNKTDKNAIKRANNNYSLSKEQDTPTKKRLKKSPVVSLTSEFVSSSIYQPQNTSTERVLPEMQQFTSATSQSASTSTSTSTHTMHPPNYQRISIVPFSLDLDAFSQELSEEQELENKSDSMEDEGAIQKVYGNVITKVVGVRYYDGVVNRNESVSITREPFNMYDRNALRADNILGVQVGHIPRDVAAVLAPLIDNGNIRIEGTITGNKGAYSAPLHIHVLGVPEREEQITKTLRSKNLKFVPLKPMTQGRKASEPNEAWRELMKQGRTLDKMSTKKVLQEVGVSIVDLARLPEAPQPEALITPLLSYQKQGLGWMLSNEHPEEPTTDKSTQFWIINKKDGEYYYYNAATKFLTKTRPNFARGGILADDMVLEKHYKRLL